MIKGNKKTINAIDVLLVLFALAVVAVLAIHLIAANLGYDFSQKKQITVDILVEKAELYDNAVISAGDAVFNTETGELIGRVLSVNYANSFDNTPSATITYPDLYDIRLSISVQTTDKQNSIYKTGKVLKLNVPSVAFSGRITNIVSEASGTHVAGTFIPTSTASDEEGRQEVKQ